MENNKVGVIMGVAGDSSILSMVLPTYEEAKKYAEGAFGRLPDAEGSDEKGRKSSIWELSFEDTNSEDDEELVIEKFFTSYYDGCGGCSAIEVVEIEFGSIVQSFSLD